MEKILDGYLRKTWIMMVEKVGGKLQRELKNVLEGGEEGEKRVNGKR